jgi:hypothetical protein
LLAVLKVRDKTPARSRAAGFILWYADSAFLSFVKHFTQQLFSFRKFDKRSYMDGPPPRNLVQPPAFVKSDLARLIISMFNEATDSIPCWDQYVANKVVTTKC